MKSERDRQADVKNISGQNTGAFAIHPFTGDKVQIWIGDYVLASYGTGAVMAVPCGDQRDYDFAKHFGIDIINIFEDKDISEEAYSEKDAIITKSDFCQPEVTRSKAEKRIRKRKNAIPFKRCSFLKTTLLGRAVSCLLQRRNSTFGFR